MTARSDLQIEVRLRNFKLGEKHVRHISVIVLSGMNQGLPHTALSNGAENWRRLNKIRARANDVENVVQLVTLIKYETTK